MFFINFKGLMSTSAIIFWTLHKLSIPVDIRNVCVFLAPVFASFTSVAGFLITKFQDFFLLLRLISLRKSRKDPKLGCFRLCSSLLCLRIFRDRLLDPMIMKAFRSLLWSSRSMSS